MITDKAVGVAAGSDVGSGSASSAVVADGAWVAVGSGESVDPPQAQAAPTTNAQRNNATAGATVRRRRRADKVKMLACTGS